MKSILSSITVPAKRGGIPSLGFAVSVLAAMVSLASQPYWAHGAPLPLITPNPVFAAGDFHSVAMKTNGTLWTWGRNNYGQLGDGSTNDQHAPVELGTEDTWSIVAAGDEHVVALKIDGGLWAWGRNNAGQLGDGTTIDRHVPVQIGTAQDWIALAAGQWHTVALKTDGSLWAGGWNAYGQLGDGTLVNKLVPVRIGLANDWVAVAAAHSHALALKADGSLWAWGRNHYGQLGIGGAASQSIPVRIDSANDWAAIEAGGADNTSHSVALKTDGSFWGWGRNGSGQLGTGGFSDTYSPIRIGTANDWTAIAAGYAHTVMLKAGGTLWGCGFSGFGNILVNTTPPVQIGTATSWVGIAAGRANSLALQSDGSLWAFGDNFFGMLGDGTTTGRSLPVRIGTDTDWGPPVPRPPMLLLSPHHLTISPGDNITFTVQAAGSRTLTYQWQFNALDIAGATNAVLTLTNASLAQVGTYSVIVSNPFGTVASSPATLTLLSIQTYAGLMLAGPVGTEYGIDYRSAFGNSNTWTTLTNLVLPSSPYLFFDLDSPNARQRFYRAVPVR